MATTTVYFASHLIGNINTPNNALGAPDGTYTTNIDNSSWTSQFQFTDVGSNATATGTQTITIRCRKQDGTDNPTIDTVKIFDLATEGAEILGGATAVTSLTQQDIVINVDGSNFPSPLVDVGLEIATTAAGGSPSRRAAVQIDSVTWDVNYTESTTSQLKYWNGSSWVLKPLKRWNGSSWADTALKRWDGSQWVLV